MKALQGVVVIHPTAYDGCVELAALQMGHAVWGSSNVESSYRCAREVVKNHLLQALVGCVQMLFETRFAL